MDGSNASQRMVRANATIGGKVSFNLDNYVDVPTRLRMALDKFPDLRVQESQPTFREVNDKLYIEIRCTVWRDKDDQLPCIAYCWEPFPGRTPYTKDSEQMNASTSALGRALGMMGFGIDHKMASKQEVMARQEQPRVEIARYDDGEPIPDPFTGEPQTNVVPMKAGPGKASEKQIGMIRVLAKTRGFTPGSQTMREIGTVLNREIVKLDELSKQEASAVITAWKN
jgi:hypothetical protein